MEKVITYMGQKVKVGCDEKCNKAWGVNRRPRVYSELGEKIYGLNGESIYPKEELKDIDDHAMCSDDELGEAPTNPGTYEGGEAKPTHSSQIPNKWCVRECERCDWSEPGKFNEPLVLKDFSKRRYNQPWKHKANTEKTKLTAENVEKVFNECLFKDGEPTDNHKVGEGIRINIGFHPDRLKSAEPAIEEMLGCLHDNFRKSIGGGWSFLQMCEDKDGNQWADHQTMEKLVCLGTATGKMSFMLPRAFWMTLPGGMPYLVIN